MVGIKVSIDKHISRWVDWENSGLIESKTVHKDKEGGW